MHCVSVNGNRVWWRDPLLQLFIGQNRPRGDHGRERISDSHCNSRLHRPRLYDNSQSDHRQRKPGNSRNFDHNGNWNVRLLWRSKLVHQQHGMHPYPGKHYR